MSAEHSKVQPPKCAGHRVSGYWKNHPCGAVPKYILPNGTTWCRAHVPFNRGRIKLL